MALRLLATVIGAAGGFAYYYYIGCESGSCAITSNPWISTIYGAFIGFLILPQRQKQISETITEHSNDELRHTQNN